MNLRILLLAILSTLLLSLQAQSIGIIGSSTPGGWDADTDMTQDADNTNLWSIDVTLIDGAAKFRENDDWAVNWGGADFPVGIGTQDGPDIPVFAGDYTVTLDTSSGEYNFQVHSDIGIIGSATPNGWDNDTDMFQDAVDTNKYFITLDLVVGEAKFRQFNDWATNWGSADFPIGTGTQDGENVMVDKAGTYYITFDKSTGEYEFGEEITYGTIGIIGDATPGGWDADTDMTQNAANPDVWNVTIELTDGFAKFRAENDWIVSWGGEDFPVGTATLGGPDIPVTAGTYQVSLNVETGEYIFLEVVDYGTVGIIGSATPGGWDADTDMEKDLEDGAIWTLREILLDGELKFRADDDWAVNWGSGDFPTGVADLDGANIPIPAGEYIITFNTVTGEYNFEAIVVFSTVGIIGTGSPTMGWDDDTDMIKDLDNEFLFTLSSTELFDGEVKFRAEDDWAVNWGSEDFPIGVGTQDGANIPMTAGTYDISLITDTGDYAFSDPNSNENILLPSAVALYPNPANSYISLEINDNRLQGEIEVSIIDMTGSIVLTQNLVTGAATQINIESIPTGHYTVRIRNDKNLIGKKLTIIK